MNKIALIFGTMVGVAAVATPPVLQPSVKLVYNATSSAPLGWYRIQSAASLKVGDYVLATLPAHAAALAAQRGYLPAGIPILKQVSALPGQHVCVQSDALLIDGAPVVHLLHRDQQDRPLPGWRECRKLDRGELLLLGMTNSSSFDGRYFGPVPASSVRGQAVPLWTWNAP